MVSSGGRIRYILYYIALFCALGSVTATASTTTTLLSEDFYGGPFPPTGWSHDHGGSTPGSYWSQHGAGGHNGSWVMNMWDCRWDRIYSPSLNLSSYDPQLDSVFVEFDVYMEFNWKDEQQVWSHGHGGSQFQVFPDNGDGGYLSASPLLDLSYTSDYYTYDNSAYGNWWELADPNTSWSSWRHYKMMVPSTYWYSTFRLVFFAQTIYNCNGGNIAFDNVVVSVKQPQLISYEPTAMDFGGLIIGRQSEPQCVSITNNSSASVAISSAVIAGDGAGEFQIVGEVPESIAPHASVDICVVFAPTIHAVDSAELVVNNASDNNPEIIVTLRGIGLQPLIELIPVDAHNTPTRLFTQVYVTLGDTLEQTMLVKNVGDGNLRVCGSTDIGGDFPNEYFISQLPSDGIPAGGIDTIRVKFTPTMEGLHRAELNVVSNALNGTQYVDLNGTGILPKIVVEPNPLTFDSLLIGGNVRTDLRISNPGSDTLWLLNQVISSNDGDFVFDLLPRENSFIPPGMSRFIGVNFMPKRPGIRTATLTLFTNIPLTFEYEAGGAGEGGGSYLSVMTPIRRDTGTIRVEISGTGVPYGELFLSRGGSGDAKLDSTIIGTTVCAIDTIWNFGEADIKISDMYIQGLNASEFGISNPGVPFIVRAKTYHTVEVCATPAQRGIRAATMVVKGTSAELSLQASLPVVVFGQEVCASLNPDNTVPLFEEHFVVKNTDSVLCVEVTNCGDVTAVYSAHLTDDTYYTVTPSQSPSVQPGQSTTFCVRFVPTGVGEFDSRLVVGTEYLNSMVLDLKGIGACANLSNREFTVPITNVGGHSTFAVTIDNTGNYDYVLGTPSLVQPDSAYRLIEPVPTVVPSGGNVQIMIGYDPTKHQTTYTGALTFPNGGPCTDNEVGVSWMQVTGTEGVTQTTEESGYVLGQNYPNPTPGQTSFTFTTPNEANVTVRLSNLTGYVVRTLIDGRVSEGSHVVTFDGSDLASGTYIYTLESEGVRLTRLLVLTK
ncbi:MAG: choice-of-anchor D domain-containing protein [Bacteroidetes bacterium]|nr:choice-of-anchor D domain-containing protein [Bacteroidota bacterium]